MERLVKNVDDIPCIALGLAAKMQPVGLVRFHCSSGKIFTGMINRFMYRFYEIKKEKNIIRGLQFH